MIDVHQCLPPLLLALTPQGNMLSIGLVPLLKTICTCRTHSKETKEGCRTSLHARFNLWPSIFPSSKAAHQTDIRQVPSQRTHLPLACNRNNEWRCADRLLGFAWENYLTGRHSSTIDLEQLSRCRRLAPVLLFEIVWLDSHLPHPLIPPSSRKCAGVLWTSL